MVMHCWNQEGNFHFPACFRCVNIENKYYFWLRWEKDLEECVLCWRFEFYPCGEAWSLLWRDWEYLCVIQKAITVELSLWSTSSSLCFLLVLNVAFVKILLLASNKLQDIQLGYVYCNTIVRYLSKLYVECNLRHSKL